MGWRYQCDQTGLIFALPMGEAPTKISVSGISYRVLEIRLMTKSDYDFLASDCFTFASTFSGSAASTSALANKFLNAFMSKSFKLNG